jgi:hypothetical protein
MLLQTFHMSLEQNFVQVKIIFTFQPIGENFILIITLNVLMYWVILRMEKWIIIICIKTKTCFWRLIFVGFSGQYPSIHLNLYTYIFRIYVNYRLLWLLSFECHQLCTCFYTKRYDISCNKSKFTWMTGLEGIVKNIKKKGSCLFEVDQIICT